MVNVADLRLAAQKRLPRVVFDYIDGAADAEVTLRENSRAFQDVTFRPRSAVATPKCDLSTTVLGTRLDLPFLLAPIGSSRVFYPRGEEVAARAAGEDGTTYILSTLSGCHVSDVKKATSGPVWFQLYLVGGRDIALGGIERARTAGCSDLVVTVDTPVAGMRERDVRNGMKPLASGRPLAMLPHLGQFLMKPRWLAAYLADGGLMNFPNIVLPSGPMPYADVGAALEASMVSWDDLKWIREAWQGKVVVKGVHTADDARQAMDAGADAVVVSNHGGRQLDGVAATIRVLPEVVAAVDGRVEVLLDGGIRRGGDIIKALCLGARAVLIGRAYAYGLGAAGGTGVTRAIDILRADIVRTLQLLGVPSTAALDRSLVGVPADWHIPGSMGPWVRGFSVALRATFFLKQVPAPTGAGSANLRTHGPPDPRTACPTYGLTDRPGRRPPSPVADSISLATTISPASS
ncbi:MAG: alpha-hydroxy-acid oxidizing protein [Acidobacteria bacterium]|nr:alpha-hydroxy-acid oxidizing protein [Acidobacteriota bacterium]